MKDAPILAALCLLGCQSAAFSHEDNQHVHVNAVRSGFLYLTSVHGCSDDQLLNEDSGWGAYLEGRQRHGARGAAIPRSADPADLPSSYAESMTSPTQPSPQVRGDSSFAHWHVSHKRQTTCLYSLWTCQFQSRVQGNEAGYPM